MVRVFISRKTNGVKLLTHSFGEYAFLPEHVFSSVQDASNQATRLQWDYVVVTTKALPTISNSEVTLIKPLISPATTIVLIQNGIGVEQPYRSTFPQNVLLSSVTIISAEQIEHGVVRQNRWTRITTGPYTGSQFNQNSGDLTTKSASITRHFVQLLKDGGIKDAEEYDEKDLQFVRWHKVAINACFNPSSVLSNGAPSSAMAADPLLKPHLIGTMREVLNVATAVLQSPLPSKFASPEKIIESTLRNTADNFNNKNKSLDGSNKGESFRPSMWYDWAQGRPMELEVILGNIVREAERVGVDVPRVQSMYALLCMAQKRRDADKVRSKL